MNEEDLMLSNDDNLEELLRQRLLAQKQQQQVGVGAEGAVGAGLAGFGALLAGQNPQAATQSVLNTAQQMQQNRLRQQALEQNASLGALRALSQERQRKEQMQNALERISAQNRFKQEEFDRRFPLESAEKARRAGIIAQSQQDLAKIRGDLQSQLEERRLTSRAQESAADRALREKLVKDKMAQDAIFREKDLGLKEKSLTMKADKQDKVKSAPVVYGYTLLQGAEPNEQDAKKVKQMSSGMQSANIALDKIKEMVQKYGVRSLPGSEGRKNLNSATKQLVISAKEAANLGALAGPDMDIVLGMIGDPTGIEAAYMGDDGYLRVLEQAKNLMNQKHGAEVRAYGYTPSSVMQLKSSGASNNGEQRMINGVPYRKVQGGWERVK